MHQIHSLFFGIVDGLVQIMLAITHITGTAAGKEHLTLVIPVVSEGYVSVRKVHHVKWFRSAYIDCNLLNIKRFQLINLTGDPSCVVRNRNLGDSRVFRCAAFRGATSQGKSSGRRP